MKKQINNKGFTLVELLAVMVILISISMVAVIGITSSLEKSEKKECEHQKELVINAAKIYFSLEGGTCVQISVLKSKGYIKDEKKIDTLDQNYRITLKNNQYKYQSSC